MFLSFVSAFGGGVVRDLLVGTTPFIFTEMYPLLVSLCIVVISLFFKLPVVQKLEHSKLFVLSDSIGLSIFAYTGSSIGMHYDFNFMGVVFLGLLTATGGGIFRDVMIQKTPYIFKEDFYGTVAIIVGILTFFFGMYPITIIIIGVLLRILAVKFKWKLPKTLREN